MRDSSKARYFVVSDKPSLNFTFYGEGELDKAQEHADRINGCLIKANGEDVEIVHTLVCNPEDHKHYGIPVKKLPA